LIVKETTFEFLPLHAVAEINPIPPETKVVPPSGGLNTKTSTVPGCAMSVAVTVATNRRLLVMAGKPCAVRPAAAAESVSPAIFRRYRS